MESYQHGPQFKIVQQFMIDGAHTCTQYQSQQTGMSIVVIDREGPKVHGYFAFGTEIDNDSGAPHTLEHLCFKGSRKYPFFGLLDTLSDRTCSRINAATSVDRTVYTLETVGWEGFVHILPIYLDHLIFPSLTDESCYTEVHHIDGTGYDAGVVYSEMQGRQNLRPDLVGLEMRRLLFPEESNLRRDTGGRVEVLRILSADRIREFHRAMYLPNNLRLVVDGNINHKDLLKTLASFEQDSIDSVPSYAAPFQRPWSKSRLELVLPRTTIHSVEFPEEDDSTGEISIGFIGPESMNEKLNKALEIVLAYLAGSSASILVNVLVEREHRISNVQTSILRFAQSIIYIKLNGVASEKLADVERRFWEVLQDHVSKPLDLDFLKDCLRGIKRDDRYTAEIYNRSFNTVIITDHLYGPRNGTKLQENLGTLKIFDELEIWEEDDWRSFIRTWIVKPHHISLLGKPSPDLAKRIKHEEIQRIRTQQAKLGEAGLKEKARQLEKAKAENNRPVPPALIEKINIPDIESIHFHKTRTARSGVAEKLKAVIDIGIQEIINQDKKGPPLFIHYESVRTSFVHISFVLGTAAVPAQLKPMLSLYFENFFSTPIMRDGKSVRFEQVAVDLRKVTSQYGIRDGYSIGNEEMWEIYFVAESDKYKDAVQRLTELLLNLVFDTGRLITAAKKILAYVSDEKRHPYHMLYSIDDMIHYSKASSVHATSTLVKAAHLELILEQLQTEPRQVVKKLVSLHQHILALSNLRILAIADFETIPNPVSTFHVLGKAIRPGPNATINPIDDRISLLSDIGRNPGGAHFITPIATDSSFAMFTTQGPSSYNSPDLPPLLVALAYLSASEGPIWKAIRGPGHAYGFRFSYDIEVGFLKFCIDRSPNLYAAYKEARTVVKEYEDGIRRFHKLALEGAVSRIIYDLVSERATVVDAALRSFVDLEVRRVGKGWLEGILRQVKRIKEEDVRRILPIVSNVFDPDHANLVIISGSAMLEHTRTHFGGDGFRVTVKELSNLQKDYSPHGNDDNGNMDRSNDLWGLRLILSLLRNMRQFDSLALEEKARALDKATAAHEILQFPLIMVHASHWNPVANLYRVGYWRPPPPLTVPTTTTIQDMQVLEEGSRHGFVVRHVVVSKDILREMIVLMIGQEDLDRYRQLNGALEDDGEPTIEIIVPEGFIE